MIKKTPILYRELNSCRLINIFECEAPEYYEKVLDMWERNKALPDHIDPEERVKQVLLVALSPEDKAVSVNTAYESTLSEEGMPEEDEGDKFFAYRMFIEDGQTVMWMPIVMTSGSFDILQALNKNENRGCKGVLIRAENARVAHPSSLSEFERRGWTIFGEDKKGVTIIRRDFDYIKKEQ